MIVIRKAIFIILCGFFALGCSHGQGDLHSWSSLSLSKKINNTTVVFKPIARFNESLSNYNNGSLDLIVKQKIGTQWQFAFLERYWWLDDGVNRNFWFIDMGYRFKASEKIVLSQYIRWHIAQDIEIEDPNFLRWHPSIELATSSKFKPYAGIEFFMRLDGINDLQRLRSKIGGTYVISDKIQVLLRLWREDFVNVSNPREDYVIEFNLGYKL